MTITDTIANTYYKSDEEMGNDLAIAINTEIKRLVDVGCKYIQVDEPLFARKTSSIKEKTIKQTMSNVTIDKKALVIVNCIKLIII